MLNVLSLHLDKENASLYVQYGWTSEGWLVCLTLIIYLSHKFNNTLQAIKVAVKLEDSLIAGVISRARGEIKGKTKLITSGTRTGDSRSECSSLILCDIGLKFHFDNYMRLKGTVSRYKGKLVSRVT